MADDLGKLVAVQPTPTAKRIAQDKGVSSEERRILDALEDDDVKESLKELRAHKGKRD